VTNLIQNLGYNFGGRLRAVGRGGSSVIGRWDEPGRFVAIRVVNKLLRKAGTLALEDKRGMNENNKK
jgi:hypothetical protein